MLRLKGRTIVITRPQGQGDSLALKLRSDGAKVLLAPVIKIMPPRSYQALDKALHNLDNFDTVLFTSANGVRRFFARAMVLRLGLLPRPKALYAIGTETAAALRQAGWHSARTPAHFRGEALVGELGTVKGRKILIPRALVAREALPENLRRAGARVTCVEAYRTEPDVSSLRRIRRIIKDGIDAVTFTSESTVRHFFAGLGAKACRRLFSRAAAASIGPVTSAALRREGCRPALQASRSTADSLRSALLKHLRNDSRL